MNKKLTEAELIERDSKRDIAEEILQAIRELKAGKTGRVFVFKDGTSTEIVAKRQLH